MLFIVLKMYWNCVKLPTYTYYAKYIMMQVHRTSNLSEPNKRNIYISIRTPKKKCTGPTQQFDITKHEDKNS